MPTQKPIKIRKYMKNKLFNQYKAGHGKSRGEVKDKFNHSDLIHSHNTYKTYQQQCDKFADWCMNRTPPYRFFDTKEHLNVIVYEYMEELNAKGMSAWTQATALNAIAHAFEMRTRDFTYELPSRKRGDITRSRQAVDRDTHINPTHHKTTIAFCRAFGFRNNKELKELRSEQFTFHEDGSITCHIYGRADKSPEGVSKDGAHGKGNRGRDIVCQATKEELRLIKTYLQTHEGRLNLDVPSGLDVHGMRREFAKRVYDNYARDTKTLAGKDLYICRKDKAGMTFDRQAAEVVTQMLGHNRLSVAIDHYLT